MKLCMMSKNTLLLPELFVYGTVCMPDGIKCYKNTYKPKLCGPIYDLSLFLKEHELVYIYTSLLPAYNFVLCAK